MCFVHNHWFHKAPLAHFLINTSWHVMSVPMISSVTTHLSSKNSWTNLVDCLWESMALWVQMNLSPSLWTIVLHIRPSGVWLVNSWPNLNCISKDVKAVEILIDHTSLFSGTVINTIFFCLRFQNSQCPNRETWLFSCFSVVPEAFGGAVKGPLSLSKIAFKAEEMGTYC